MMRVTYGQWVVDGPSGLNFLDQPAKNLLGQANEIRFIKDNVEEGKKDQPHWKTLWVNDQIAPFL